MFRKAARMPLFGYQICNARLGQNRPDDGYAGRGRPRFRRQAGQQLGISADRFRKLLIDWSPART
jgi:hypothetical protein